MHELSKEKAAITWTKRYKPGRKLIDFLYFPLAIYFELYLAKVSVSSLYEGIQYVENSFNHATDEREKSFFPSDFSIVRGQKTLKTGLYPITAGRWLD